MEITKILNGSVVGFSQKYRETPVLIDRYCYPNQFNTNLPCVINNTYYIYLLRLFKDAFIREVVKILKDGE